MLKDTPDSAHAIDEKLVRMVEMRGESSGSINLRRQVSNKHTSPSTGHQV